MQKGIKICNKLLGAPKSEMFTSIVTKEITNQNPDSISKSNAKSCFEADTSSGLMWMLHKLGNKSILTEEENPLYSLTRNLLQWEKSVNPNCWKDHDRGNQACQSSMSCLASGSGESQANTILALQRGKGVGLLDGDRCNDGRASTSTRSFDSKQWEIVGIEEVSPSHTSYPTRNVLVTHSSLEVGNSHDYTLKGQDDSHRVWDAMKSLGW
ncbi:hypothetical protein VNO78_13412 [Psophocarpus tetragonolobus]|uniref:Uncharacterized protein n=1 Tax=Psophocarpus tetragonolobus TaxID=3891 RepID=A0AAN9SYV8_PSOTE